MKTLLERTLEKIVQANPKSGIKLKASIEAMDEEFHQHAEGFLGRFERFMAARGESFDYGVECFLKLRECMLQERSAFLRSGQYANRSFAEVERQIYENPAVMHFHMYGLIFAQFLWPDQYQRFRFFRERLPEYRDGIASYLEIGGGHGLYIDEAVRLLRPDTTFDLVDISSTSLELARGMCAEPRIQYHLMDMFDFPVERKFDFIAIGEVIEHLEQPLAMLRKVRELLSAAGRAYVTTPANAPMIDHIYLFRNAEEIRAMLRQSGFEIERETSCYAEEMSSARAEKLKIPLMYAAFVRPA